MAEATHPSSRPSPLGEEKASSLPCCDEGANGGGRLRRVRGCFTRNEYSRYDGRRICG